MKRTRVLLLIDWDPQEGCAFKDFLNDAGLECDVTGFRFSFKQWTPFIKRFLFWPKCFQSSIKAFSLRHNYDYIIAWQQVTGIMLGFLMFIFNVKKPRVMILSALISKRDNLFIHLVRKFFTQLGLIGVHEVGCFSDKYLELIKEEYSLPDDKAICLPYAINTADRDEIDPVRLDSYIYSVGLSLRDYESLMDAAARFPRQFVIATQPFAVRGLSIPTNVILHFDTFGDKALTLMKNASVVVLTLSDIYSPAGEATLFEAMWYKKPVIVTNTITTYSYIDDKHNGLLIDYRSPDAIVNALEYVFSDEKRSIEMGQRAYEKVVQNYTYEILARRIADMIQLKLS